MCGRPPLRGAEVGSLGAAGEAVGKGRDSYSNSNSEEESRKSDGGTSSGPGEG